MVAFLAMNIMRDKKTAFQFQCTILRLVIIDQYRPNNNIQYHDNGDDGDDSTSNNCNIAFATSD